MGLLRFREGEERRGRFRGWESYIRDYQYLARFPTQVPTGLRSMRAVQKADKERIERKTTA